VIGAAFYLTVVGLLAIGLAALPRNTAAGISALFGLLFVIPIVVRFLASSWADPISSYLPGSAGRALPHVHPDPAMLAPRTGFGLFSAYANAGTSGSGWGTGDDHSVANAQPSRRAIVTSSRSAALAPTVALPFRSHVSTENHERQH
jgi:hypothetical protein